MYKITNASFWLWHNADLREVAVPLASRCRAARGLPGQEIVDRTAKGLLAAFHEASVDRLYDPLAVDHDRGRQCGRVEGLADRELGIEDDPAHVAHGELQPPRPDALFHVFANRRRIADEIILRKEEEGHRV